MTSSRRNLAVRKTQLTAIAEFANAEDSPERWIAFQKRWPALLPSEILEDSLNQIEQNAEWARRPVVAEYSPRMLRLGKNSVVEVGQYRPTEDGRWVQYLKPKLLHFRDLLREAWRGGMGANQGIEELLGLRSPSGELHDVWAPSLSADWSRGSLVFNPRNLFESACYALLQNSGLAKVCANSDCPAQYFIGRRATQRYCSPDCLKPFQKQSKLDWWNREGKLRRAKSTKPQKRS